MLTSPHNFPYLYIPPVEPVKCVFVQRVYQCSESTYTHAHIMTFELYDWGRGLPCSGEVSTCRM